MADVEVHQQQRKHLLLRYTQTLTQVGVHSVKHTQPAKHLVCVCVCVGVCVCVCVCAFVFNNC